MPAQSIIAITALKHIRIEERLGRGVQIDDDPSIFLTNDSAVLKKLLSKDFVTAMGTIEAMEIINCECAFYSKFDVDIPDSKIAIKLIDILLFSAKAFFQSLWMIKDNAADCELCFLQWMHPTDGLHHSSNFIPSNNSSSQGLFVPTQFSIEEIKRARQFYRLFGKPFVFYGFENPSPKGKMGSPGNIVSTKGVPRLVRAHYFLSGARVINDIGVKLSLYISCLEVLFSTDPSELAHKLSERVALFLGRDATDRKSIFSALKRAYRVRSKVLHGDVMTSDSQRDLGIVSQQVDGIIRSAFERICGNEELHSLLQGELEKIDEYFLDMVFKENNPSTP